jgi:hypothetical protein
MGPVITAMLQCGWGNSKVSPKSMALANDRLTDFSAQQSIWKPDRMAELIREITLLLPVDFVTQPDTEVGTRYLRIDTHHT